MSIKKKEKINDFICNNHLDVISYTKDILQITKSMTKETFDDNKEEIILLINDFILPRMQEALKQGKTMERRMKKYCFGIEKMGFIRIRRNDLYNQKNR